MLNATSVQFIPPFKTLNSPIIVPVVGQLVPTVVAPPVISTTAPPTAVPVKPTTVVPPDQLVPTNVVPNSPTIPTTPTISPEPPTTSIPPSPPPVITYSPAPQPDPVPPYHVPTTTTHTGGSDSFFKDDWYNTPSYSSPGRNTLRVQNKFNRPHYPLVATRPIKFYGSSNTGYKSSLRRENSYCNPPCCGFQSFLPLLKALFSGHSQPAVPVCPPYRLQQPSRSIFNFNFNFGPNTNFLTSNTEQSLFNW